MDWSKAKNLLIFLFLALNIFLAVYLFMSFHNNSGAENILNTEKILRDRGYDLNTKIPNISKGYMLKYENGKYDSAFIAENLLNKSKISEKEIKINLNHNSWEQPQGQIQKNIQISTNCPIRL